MQLLSTTEIVQGRKNSKCSDSDLFESGAKLNVCCGSEKKIVCSVYNAKVKVLNLSTIQCSDVMCTADNQLP